MAWYAEKGMRVFERAEPSERTPEKFDDFYAREFTAVVGQVGYIDRLGVPNGDDETFEATQR